MAQKPKLTVVRPGAHLNPTDSEKRVDAATDARRAEPHFGPAPAARMETAPPPLGEGKEQIAKPTAGNRAINLPTAARVRGRFSSLTLRILVLNIIAIAILVAGLLYLDLFRESLVDAKRAALETEGRIIAAALGEGAAVGEGEGLKLDSARVQQILRRVAEPTTSRARLFDIRGVLLADSAALLEAGRSVQAGSLDESAGPIEHSLVTAYDWIIDRVPGDTPLAVYVEQTTQRASDYDEVVAALGGESAGTIRAFGDGQILSIAFPVQSFKKILGAVMLSTDMADIEASVRDQRFAILGVSGLALLVTVLLSLYLARTIATPVRRLAAAADLVRGGRFGRPVEIPDFTGRRDEIGDLSGSLRAMTRELYDRLGAIESFATDVAHEIKNPLTSIHSAIEAMDRASDPAQREKLLTIIRDDVGRIDRLISDISDASRLDVELSRSLRKPVDIRALCEALAEVHHATAIADAPAIKIELEEGVDLVVPGIDDRLGQVMRNVIANAQTFSPPDGSISVSVHRRLGAIARDDSVEIVIEDDGPGFTADTLEKAFERFYSARPAGEAFGKHSGLGLNISRQIVEAHGGQIWPENREGAGGTILGARIILRLPVTESD